MAGGDLAYLLGCHMWVKRFLQKLISGDIDNALCIKAKNLPKSVFKFRAVNEYSIDNFKTNSLWVSSADQFNDPYDCFYTLSFDELASAMWCKNKEQIKTFVLEKSKQHNCALTLEEINRAASINELAKIILSADKNIPPQNHNRIIESAECTLKGIFESHHTGRFRNILQKNMGICSLSKTNSSLRMWRSYGDNHQGFSLEYDLTPIKRDSPLANCLFPVVYTSNLPDMTAYFTVDENKFNNLFGIIAAMHKSKEWKYEKEWRIILPLGEKYCSKKFNMPRPKAIYIGIEAERNDRNILLNIAAQKGIGAYVMQFRSDSYRLKAVSITN
jgi:hypothetical protein